MMDENTLYRTVAPLRNVAALLTLIDRLQNRTFGLPGMGTFYGPSGWGKTFAATYTINRLRTCHIEIKSLWRSKQVLKEIAIELGETPARTAPDLFDQVAARLSKTQRPLILDEADYLMTHQMIELVRGLHEASGVPVILIGEEALPTKLQRWERVHGRILSSVGVQPADMADVAHLAAIYAAGVEVAEDLRAHLLAQSNRSIRYASINLAMVKEHCTERGLTRINRRDWGDRPLFAIDAPPPRREEVQDRERRAAIARITTRRAG